MKMKAIVTLVTVVSIAAAQGGIVKRVFTDKSVYAYGEKVVITIRAVNNSQSGYTIVFPNSCEAYPYIDTMRYLNIFGMGCATILLPVTIPPHDSVEWIRDYPPAGKPGVVMPVGKHRIYGYFTSSESTTDTIEIEVVNSPNSVKSGRTVDSFTLFDPYPNPFNPSTTLSFQLPQRSLVSLMITDMFGRTIETLINGAVQPGLHEQQWHPKNVSSGLYFADLTIDGVRVVQKIIFVK